MFYIDITDIMNSALWVYKKKKNPRNPVRNAMEDFLVLATTRVTNVPSFKLTFMCVHARMCTWLCWCENAIVYLWRSENNVCKRCSLRPPCRFREQNSCGQGCSQVLYPLSTPVGPLSASLHYKSYIIKSVFIIHYKNVCL